MILTIQFDCAVKYHVGLLHYIKLRYMFAVLCFPTYYITLYSPVLAGGIGDWKNHFTVADNELFEAFLDKWTVSKEIPFRY